MEKKGLSEVVTTILIILLTVVAFVIIGGFVVPFVKNSLNQSTSCFSYKEYYKFDDSFSLNCLKISGGENLYAFSIRKSSDKKLESGSNELDIVLRNANGEIETAKIKDGGTSSKNIGGVSFVNSASTTLKTPNSGGIISYLYKGSINNHISAELYPVLKSGRICREEKEEITVGSCPAGIVLS